MSYEELVKLRILLKEFKDMTGHEAPELVSVIYEVMNERISNRIAILDQEMVLPPEP